MAKAAAKAGVKIVLSPSVMATSLVGILVEMLAAIKASPALRAVGRVADRAVVLPVAATRASQVETIAAHAVSLTPDLLDLI